MGKTAETRAGGDFGFFILYKWRESPWGQRDRSALPGEETPLTPQVCRASRASLSRLLPPFLSPTSCSPGLILMYCVRGTGAGRRAWRCGDGWGSESL